MSVRPSIFSPNIQSGTTDFKSPPLLCRSLFKLCYGSDMACLLWNSLKWSSTRRAQPRGDGSRPQQGIQAFPGPAVAGVCLPFPHPHVLTGAFSFSITLGSNTRSSPDATSQSWTSQSAESQSKPLSSSITQSWVVAWSNRKPACPREAPGCSSKVKSNAMKGTY